MHYEGLLSSLPKEIKLFIGAFMVVLSIGFFTGLMFIGQTESHHPQGIEENYLGNEETTSDFHNEDVAVMKFKKGEREMLTILHTHILSLSFIFFLSGGILLLTRLNKKIKRFLLLEPFISVIVTFGGIYLMWKGILWMKYLVMVSGILMTACFLISVLIIFKQLFETGKKSVH